MKTYCIRYRIGPRVEESKDLLVEAPDARVAAEKAHEVLRLRYPHHIVEGIFPGLSFNSDPAEMYGRRAGGRR
jgi:hypothetical protein